MGSSQDGNLGKGMKPVETEWSEASLVDCADCGFSLREVEDYLKTLSKGVSQLD